MIRFALLLAACLAFSASTARADDGFTPAQKAQLQTIIHDYIIAHPDAVIQSLNDYQRNEDSAAKQKYDQNYPKYAAFLTDAATPFAGNPNGTHVVVEFFDYNCPYCKKSVNDILTLIQSDPQAKVYLKDFPILSPTSVDAARWALAAGKQGKYLEFHVAMMKTLTPGERSSEDMYIKIATQLGLDLDRMRKDVNDPSIKDTLQKNLDAARALDIEGTPGFIIGGKLYDGYMGLANMQKVISVAYAAPKGTSPGAPAGSPTDGPNDGKAK